MEPLFFSEQVSVENKWDFKNGYDFKEVFEERNGFIKFKLCGFVILKNRLIIVLPKGVLEVEESPSNEEKAKILLQVLMKYEKSAVKNKSIHYDSQNNSDENLFSSIAKIIKDFKLHDILTTTLKEREINGSGKINWKQTLNKSMPVIQNNHPVYVELVHERKLKNLSAEITQLHWMILKEIESKFGWLFNFKTHNTSVSYLPINPIKAKKILKRAMSLTFNSFEIRRYKMLYNYVLQNYFAESSKKTNTNLLYAFKFDMVWEEMGKRIYKHSDTLMEKVPQYKWTLFDARVEYRYQRPDILVDDEGASLLIIDAKYYKFDENLGDNSLPGGPDIGKQLLYLQSMKTLKTYDKIYNIFVVPSSKEGGKKTKFYATGSYDDTDLKMQFGEILTYQVDCLTMMKHYLDNNHELYEELKSKLINP